MKYWDDNGREIWIEPEAALDLGDVEAAAETRDESGRTAISIHLTRAGAEKMRTFTSGHIGQMAAIVFEGKVMNSPVIRSAISSNAIITSGSSGVSPDQAQRILSIVNQK